jgi:hypothetical protein
MIRRPLARLAAIALGVASLALVPTTLPDAPSSTSWVEAGEYPAPAYAAFEDCTPLDVSEASGLTDDQVAFLKASGWEGSIDDGLEALYAPNCLRVLWLEDQAGGASSLVTASDGTRTINVLEADAPVHGWVITPNGDVSPWTN